MDKTKGNVILRYLLMCGADRNAFILFDKQDGKTIYQNYPINTRQDHDKLVRKINNFDGLCYVYTGLDGQDHIDTSVLINHLVINWDNTKQAKRIKRLQKIRTRISKN